MAASRILLCALLLATPALAGCMGSEDTGTFALYLSDAPNAIGDFTTLTITVSEVKLRVKDTEKLEEKERVLQPASSAFDLVKLQGANDTKLAEGAVPVGDVQRVDLAISKAEGTLKNGTKVTLDVPSGRLFLKAMEAAHGAGKVEKDKTTEFVFDVTVVKEGNGSYKLQPNAGESGLRNAAGHAHTDEHAGHA